MLSERRLSRTQSVTLLAGITIALAALVMAVLQAARSRPAVPTTEAPGAAATTVDLPFYFDRAAAAYQAGDYEGARQDYDLILQLDPENARAYLRRGDTYDELGAPGQAQTDYGEAIRLDPTLTDAYLNRALLHMKQGAYAAALTDYEQAALLEPRNANAYYGQAFAYQELDNCAGALRSYNLALQSEPTFVDAYYGRGRIFFYCYDDYDAAITDYSAAIDQRPDFANAYFARALAHQLNEDAVAAATDYEQYLALGDDPQLRAQAQAALDALEP